MLMFWNNYLHCEAVSGCTANILLKLFRCNNILCNYFEIDIRSKVSDFC